MEEFTREEIKAGTIQQSLIDHFYSNKNELISGPYIEQVGNSDHRAVRATIRSKIPLSASPVNKRKIYKHFNVESFLNDKNDKKINEKVHAQISLNDKVAELTKQIRETIHQHAPLKAIKNRQNYCKFLKEDTKQKIRMRNELRINVYKYGQTHRLEEYKQMMKEVKKQVEKDKKKDAKK